MTLTSDPKRFDTDLAAANSRTRLDGRPPRFSLCSPGGRLDSGR
jgi:hypothetical protein